MPSPSLSQIIAADYSDEEQKKKKKPKTPVTGLRDDLDDIDENDIGNTKILYIFFQPQKKCCVTNTISAR